MPLKSFCVFFSLYTCFLDCSSVAQPKSEWLHCFLGLLLLQGVSQTLPVPLAWTIQPVTAPAKKNTAILQQQGTHQRLDPMNHTIQSVNLKLPQPSVTETPVQPNVMESDFVPLCVQPLCVQPLCIHVSWVTAGVFCWSGLYCSVIHPVASLTTTQRFLMLWVCLMIKLFGELSLILLAGQMSHPHKFVRRLIECLSS